MQRLPGALPCPHRCRGHPQGVDRTEGVEWPSSRRYVSLSQVPLDGVKSSPSHLAMLEGGFGYPAWGTCLGGQGRNCFPGDAAPKVTTHECKSSCERRQLSVNRSPDLSTRLKSKPATERHGGATDGASFCAMSSGGMPSEGNFRLFA